MFGNIIQLNEDLIKNNLKDLVRDSVEGTLNARSRKPLLRSTLSAYPCAVSKISPKRFGARRSLRTPSATSTRRRTTVTQKTKIKQVTLMLKAIYAQESKEAAQEKAASIAAKLREMKLLSAAKKVEESVGETLTYMDFPTEHWSRIRTNNLTERVNREIRRRTRAIGAFPDGNSALMLACVRLRHVAASEWGSKRYMDMEHLFKMEIE